jgi:enamine deaminase RidA (YjgF/YER057c/UK114 family)
MSEKPDQVVSLETSQSIERYGVSQRWSDLVAHRGVAYFVEVPDDPTADAASQFSQVLQQIDARLALVGSTREHLLSVLIYLPNPEDLPLFNSLWDAWVPMGHAPSRACVHAQLAAPGYRVELILTAACNTSKPT